MVEYKFDNCRNYTLPYLTFSGALHGEGATGDPRTHPPVPPLSVVELEGGGSSIYIERVRRNVVRWGAKDVAHLAYGSPYAINRMGETS